MSAKPPLTLKVVLLGDSAVGKTSLLNKLSDGFGSPMADTPSLGVDVKRRTFHIDGRTVKLQVWDTAGQEVRVLHRPFEVQLGPAPPRPHRCATPSSLHLQRFKSITRSFYRDAHGVALCYDITRRDSFHGVKKWLTDIAGACAGTDATAYRRKLRRTMPRSPHLPIPAARCERRGIAGLRADADRQQDRYCR